MHRLAGLVAAFAILCGSANAPARAEDKVLVVFAAAWVQSYCGGLQAHSVMVASQRYKTDRAFRLVSIRGGLRLSSWCELQPLDSL